MLKGVEGGHNKKPSHPARGWKGKKLLNNEDPANWKITQTTPATALGGGRLTNIQVLGTNCFEKAPTPTVGDDEPGTEKKKGKNAKKRKIKSPKVLIAQRET